MSIPLAVIPLRVGVDIGGSKVAVLVVDPSDAIVGRRLVPALPSDPDAAITRIASVVRDAVAGLVGALDIQRIVLLGPVTELGERWLATVRREAAARALAPLTDDVEIVIGAPTTNVVVRGASALLVARELGLSLVR